MEQGNTKKSKQHVQIHVDHYSTIKPNDLLVLANIKRHMNKKTRMCNPSMQLIAKQSGFTIPTVSSSIKRLELAKEIIIHRSTNKANIYEFPLNAEFEMYSFEFLDNPALSKDEKAYLIGFQSCAVKNKAGFMGTTYTNEQIGKMINMSERKIKSLNKSLRQKGIFSEITCMSRNEAGFNKVMKTIDMKMIGQAIILMNDKIEQHSIDIEQNKSEIRENKAEIEEIKAQLEEVIKLNRLYVRENNRLQAELEKLKEKNEERTINFIL